MNAVILAAGVGKRLRPFTTEHPKCLLTFGGKSLLRRHLEMLDAAGVKNICVVVGHLADQVKAELNQLTCRTPIELVYNAEYRFGSALSLLQAEAALRTAVIIMDADLLFCRTMVDRLMASPAADCLLVDDRLVDSGEEVKVVSRSDGRVYELSKQVRREGAVIGESVGIYKFSAETTHDLTEALRRAVRENPQVEYETVIDSLLEHIPIRYVRVGDLPWIEIDFPQDVDRARDEIWPSIASRQTAPFVS